MSQKLQKQPYEMMYILRPDLSEELVNQEIEKYRGLLEEYQIENLQIKNLGKKRFAYLIKKFNEGYYVQMNYLANGKQVAPIERAMRLSDEVLRYLTIKTSDDLSVVPDEESSSVSGESSSKPFSSKPSFDPPVSKESSPIPPDEQPSQPEPSLEAPTSPSIPEVSSESPTPPSTDESSESSNDDPNLTPQV